MRLSIDEIIVSEYDSCLMYIPTIGPVHFFPVERKDTNFSRSVNSVAMPGVGYSARVINNKGHKKG